MKNRSEIDDKYKWDFGLLFESEQDVNNAMQIVKNGISKLKTFEGTLNTKENVNNYFKESEKVERLLMKLDLYASMKISVDATDATSLRLMEEVNQIITYYSVSLSFVGPELSKISDELLDEMIKDKTFADYDRMLESIKKEKPHTLDTEKEKMLAGMEEFTDYSSLFEKLTDAELSFDSIVDKNNNKIDLTQSNYGVFIKSPDREIRKQAYLNFWKGFGGVNLTLCHNYIGYVKKCDYLAKMYNFKSALDRKLFYDELDKKVYDKLFVNLHKNYNLYQKYLDKKAKILNISDFMAYDILAPIGKGNKYELDYDESVKLVMEMTRILGEEYNDVVKQVFSKRWVDVYPAKAKRNGAYSASVNSGNPFMLLNHENIYRSISTIAHELGHSVHSYLSEKYQPYSKADYGYFVAEVASTTNEILLAKHILKNETDIETRRYILDCIIHEFNNNVFMAGADAELEEFAHSMVNNGEPITNEDLNNKYEELLKTIYGKRVQTTDYTKYAWLRHCQFYSAFYLFKYATGFIAAVNIADNIEKRGEEYVKNYYLKFLSSGSSSDPVSLLKLADVDITSDEVYEKAFKFFDNLVDLL